jgi:hypothetical protein
VQDRLAAERMEADKQRLAQQQADLDAREKALASQTSPAPAETVIEESNTDSVVADDTESRAETRSSAAYGMFYEKLEDEGDWRETETYGYVWQPRVAEQSREWRPYTEGSWAYSDAGWTWVSNESFGWATYHYGRWVRLRRVGWVWVPGDQWAPAWVSWRTNQDYVGWAPLPPEARFDRRQGIQNWADSYYDIGPEQYAFVPSAEFGSEHIRRAVVPAERNLSIVVDTRNVTRITFANTTIVNEGPSYDELRSRSQRAVPRVHLRWQRSSETAPARLRGDELEVSAPRITEVREMPRPRRIRERVVDVNVDNGWTEIADRSAAERARTKIRTEATPPPNAPPKRFVKPRETAATPAPATPAQSADTASPTPAFSPKATATAAPASPAASAAATATPAAAASAAVSPSPARSPRMRPSPTATPVAAASAAASPTPAGSPRTRPSPSATPAAVASAAPSPTPAESPRTRPSPSIRPRPTPSVAPSIAVSPSIAPQSTAAPTAPAVMATSTPHVAPSIPPLNRVRPSPTIPMRTTPAMTPVTTQSVPAPTPAVPPPHVPRRTPPSLNPAPSVPPTTPDASAAPSVPTTPPLRRPAASPRIPMTPPPASPATTPTSSDAAQSPAPQTNPRRVPPNRPVPPMPAATPATTAPPTAPSGSATPLPENDTRARNRRPPPRTELGTPTPEPSAPPN